MRVTVTAIIMDIVRIVIGWFAVVLDIVLDVLEIMKVVVDIPLDIVATEQTRHLDSADPFVVPPAPAYVADTAAAADAAVLDVAASAVAAAFVADFAAAASAERTAESGSVDASAAPWQDMST